jgi:hypothetical protein
MDLPFGDELGIPDDFDYEGVLDYEENKTRRKYEEEKWDILEEEPLPWERQWHRPSQ